MEKEFLKLDLIEIKANCWDELVAMSKSECDATFKAEHIFTTLVAQSHLLKSVIAMNLNCKNDTGEEE